MKLPIVSFRNATTSLSSKYVFKLFQYIVKTTLTRAYIYITSVKQKNYTQKLFPYIQMLRRLTPKQDLRSSSTTIYTNFVFQIQPASSQLKCMQSFEVWKLLKIYPHIKTCDLLKLAQCVSRNKKCTRRTSQYNKYKKN